MRTLLLKGANISKNVYRMSSQTTPYREVSIPVPWGHVAGKWWGPTDMRPILTLHGWQDNCGSFDKLIPLLDKRAYLTLDLPGHGHSSWLPSGMYYYVMNYVILCRYLKEYFKWPKMSLMGHSFGGIITYSYTMFYPEDVDFLIGLDGLKPLIHKEKHDYRNGKELDRFLKLSKFADDPNEPPSYTVEEIKQKICEPNNNSINYESSEYVMTRNIKPSKLHPGKYYFSRDPRIKVFEISTFNQDDLIKWAKTVTTPILVIKAIEAGYFEDKENFDAVFQELQKASKEIEMHYVTGKHHVHLNNPEILADYVNNFIRKHDTGERKIDGIEDIIVKDDKYMSKL